VLLIDEIDRADDEFEAYLLEVLSDYQITVPEIGLYRASRPPLVVLTSNRTRDVHDALKRRCLYHWVEHPDFEREVAIVKLRVPDVDDLLARQVAGHLGVLAEEKRQTITIQCDATPHCIADRSMLRQALINLLDNAVKYTPEGGAITLPLQVAGTDSVVEVTDTGRGIAVESLERIFDCFYRDSADGGHSGFGMGLAIAKWAVEVNGGRLTVHPNPAGGSTFRMELPVARAA